MAHATHFLERLERLNSQHVEAAFSLYRDPVFVRYLLDVVHIPDNAERIALSLDDPNDGPFVVVTRNGDFVTCLGMGMSPKDLTVVPRSKLYAELSKVERFRERVAACNEQKVRLGGPSKRWDRMMRSGHRLSREDFLATAIWVPLMGTDAWMSIMDFVQTGTETLLRLSNGERYRALTRRQHTEVHAALGLWNILWLSAHLITMATKDGEPSEWVEYFAKHTQANVELSHLFAICGLRGPLVRYATAMGRLGKVFLRPCKTAYATATTTHQHAAGLFPLVAIAMKNPKLAAEIRKTLARDTPYFERAKKSINSEDFETVYTYIKTMEVQMTFKPNPDNAWRVPFLKKDLFDVFPALKKNYADIDAIPDDLAIPLAANANYNILSEPFVSPVTIGSAVSVAATVPAELLYHEEEWLKTNPDPWTVDMILKYLIDPFRNYSQAGKVIRAQETAGRNDPCPCGSGKKYKKCCGDKK